MARGRRTEAQTAPPAPAAAVPDRADSPRRVRPRTTSSRIQPARSPPTTHQSHVEMKARGEMIETRPWAMTVWCLSLVVVLGGDEERIAAAGERGPVDQVDADGSLRPTPRARPSWRPARATSRPSGTKSVTLARAERPPGSSRCMRTASSATARRPNYRGPRASPARGRPIVSSADVQRLERVLVGVRVVDGHPEGPTSGAEVGRRAASAVLELLVRPEGIASRPAPPCRGSGGWVRPSAPPRRPSSTPGGRRRRCRRDTRPPSSC